MKSERTRYVLTNKGKVLYVVDGVEMAYMLFEHMRGLGVWTSMLSWDYWRECNALGKRT